MSDSDLDYLTAKMVKDAIDRITKTGKIQVVREVSPKMYDVLKSMHDEGLISGKPYSEIEAYDEFIKRMSDEK